jgi:hypothetical protein
VRSTANPEEPENNFFSLYQAYLVQELQSADRDHQLRAVERLGEILYHAPNVMGALQELVQQKSDDEELRQVADVVLLKLQASPG